MSRNDECEMMKEELPDPAGPTAGATSTDAPSSSLVIGHSSFLCLLFDPPAPGAWNMAVDEALLESAAADGQCTLRFYRWAEPTLSLGYFQTFSDRWHHEASRKAVMVRRASGGGAILHDLELTYSFAVPDSHPLAADRLGFYNAVHGALIEALATWGIEATVFSEAKRPSPPTATTSWCPPQASDGSRPARQPFLCFQRRSPGDVLVGDVKIAGSAQRRCRGAVLQHGSVLLARSIAAPELDGIKELVDKIMEPQPLAEAWLAQLGRVLPLQWQEGGLSDEQRRRAAVLACDKYGSSAWNEHRGRG
jgi:lipoate-protein ligase A